MWLCPSLWYVRVNMGNRVLSFTKIASLTKFQNMPSFLVGTNDTWPANYAWAAKTPLVETASPLRRPSLSASIELENSLPLPPRPSASC